MLNQSNFITILPGDGKGGLGRAKAIPAGDIPTGFATGDFNGDGRPDLAYTPNFGSYSVTVLLQNGPAQAK